MILHMSQQTPVRLLWGREKSESDSQLRYAKLPGALKTTTKISSASFFSDFINIFYTRQTENIVRSRRFVLRSTLFHTASCHTGLVFALEDLPENPVQNLTLSKQVKMYDMIPSAF